MPGSPLLSGGIMPNPQAARVGFPSKSKSLRKTICKLFTKKAPHRASDTMNSTALRKQSVGTRSPSVIWALLPLTGSSESYKQIPLPQTHTRRAKE